MCCTHPLPEDHPEAGTHHGFKGTQLAISALTAEAQQAREVSSYVEGDRELRDDIERVVGLIDSGALVKAVEGS